MTPRYSPSAASSASSPAGCEPVLPIIDIHTHLAGLGQGGTGCEISSKKFNSLVFRFLRFDLGLYHAHRSGSLEEAYAQRFERDLEAAVAGGTLNACVVFGHDHIYTDAGLPASVGQELYVPNSYVFAFCSRPALRGRTLPAISVHPYRPDAYDELCRWIEQGAVALKWLPNSQNIDPGDPRCFKLYDLLAAKRVPLIAHTGGEHTVKNTRPALGNPEVLRPALDRGVNVIMAHCGTRSLFFDADWLPQFCRLARAYPNCWGDTSALNTPDRARAIPRLLRETDIVPKLIHGSDYPVPPLAWWSLTRLGWARTRALQRTKSYLARDVLIKRALGFPECVFTNAARVLPPGSLERWAVRP